MTRRLWMLRNRLVAVTSLDPEGQGEAADMGHAAPCTSD